MLNKRANRKDQTFFCGAQKSVGFQVVRSMTVNLRHCVLAAERVAFNEREANDWPPQNIHPILFDYLCGLIISNEII
jgi:hypothetical protein